MDGMIQRDIETKNVACDLFQKEKNNFFPASYDLYL